MPEPIQFDPIQVPGNQNPEPPEPENNSPEFSADDFLKNVAEEDRPHVEKYIQDWNGNVTQHLQKINEQYAPYKELGEDIDTIKNAMQIMQFADSDPLAFYEYIKETLTDMGQLEGEETPPGIESNLPEFEGLPPELSTKIQGFESTLSEISEYIKKDQESKTQQSNQQQLDKILSDLHTEHGDFDEPAILGRMAQGMKPEDAVKDYKKILEKVSNPRPVPPPFVRGGGTQMDQVDKAKLADKKFRKNYVAERLAAAAQQE